MTITVTYSTEVSFPDLTTFADCDKASDEVTFLRDTYTAQDMNSQIAARRAARSEARDTEAVARIDAEIGKLQGLLSSVTISATDRQNAQDDLEIANARRRKLLRPDEETPGFTRFMADVTGGQGDGQIAFLTQVLAGIAAHRATLSA